MKRIDITTFITMLLEMKSCFQLKKNYCYFLSLFGKYLSKLVDVYAYCLMPNHFHLIIKVKSRNEILDFSNENSDIDVPKIISKQFSHFFNSYAQAYNKQQNRKGSLFNNRYKRIEIISDEYLIKLIHYIHFNPVEANLCKKISDWRYSSYNSVLSEKETLLARDEVIKMFSDVNNFIYCHQIPPSISGIN
ncbi:MAG: transposase [Salinivirgaceae bacterium]|nr:transposase [Salinivirgaceae bacterium]